MPWSRVAPVSKYVEVVADQSNLQVYAATLEGGARAVVFFNRHVIGTQYPISNITVEWSALGLDAKCDCTVRDLFAQEDLGSFSHSLTLPVDIHDARMVSFFAQSQIQGFSSMILH